MSDELKAKTERLRANWMGASPVELVEHIGALQADNDRLRAELAERDGQEPVAYMSLTGQFALSDDSYPPDDGGEWIPLFASPPSPRPAVPEREMLRRIVDELFIMDESEGIAGFHRNGDVSPWDEGSLPQLRDEARALLATAPTPPAEGGADDATERTDVHNALDRVALRLEREAAELFDAGDYDAEFPYEDARLIRRAQQLVAASGDGRAAWRDIASAPRDGTPIQALIPGHGADAIIRWDGPFLSEDEDECFSWVMADDQEPPDSWCDGVCWHANSHGKPSVQPTHWKPAAQAAKGGDGDA